MLYGNVLTALLLTQSNDNNIQKFSCNSDEGRREQNHITSTTNTTDYMAISIVKMLSRKWMVAVIVDNEKWHMVFAQQLSNTETCDSSTLEEMLDFACNCVMDWECMPKTPLFHICNSRNNNWKVRAIVSDLQQLISLKE